MRRTTTIFSSFANYAFYDFMHISSPRQITILHTYKSRILTFIPSIINNSFRQLSTPSTPLPSITPAIESRLQEICNRHSTLVNHLGITDANSMSPQEIAKLNKELSDLDDIVIAVSQWKKLKHELEELTTMYNDQQEDQSVRDLAQEEINTTALKIPHVEHSLLLSLLPRDSADDKPIILEVRAGTGGDEACLFAGELFRMYERYAALHKWHFDIAEYSPSDVGGCKQATAEISGSDGIYGRLKFESGVHRVQRVPATESSGRVHTSAASVVVLPQVEDVDIDIRDEDLRIDVYRASGAGGQHVNTTNSAVRITHLPTGVAVAIQDERSQHKNKAKAMKIIRARIYDAEQRRANTVQSSARKLLIGSGDRSERVRTYNFPQGRVTDHRIGITEHNIQSVMNGESLNMFVDALRMQHQADLLAQLK